MRWTAEADKLLLWGLLRTFEFTPDYAAIAEIWPEDERPTPRAVRERIAKIKSDAIKEAGAMSSAASPKAASPKAKTTPRKRAKKSLSKQETETEDSEAASGAQ